MNKKTIFEVNDAIKALKQSGKRVYSNNYSMRLLEGEAVMSGQSIVLIKPDHGIDRVLFYTTDYLDLGEMIRKIEVPLTLDIITKNEEECQNILNPLGFKKLEVMRRLVNKDISEIVNKIRTSFSFTEPYGIVAAPEDTHLINQKLWSIFDTRISHLLYDHELEDCVRRGELIIRKESGQVATILQRTLVNNKFYINQVFNDTDSLYIHGILGKELIKYYESGGRYLYAWAQRSNIAANRFHEKYGMVFDGLYDVIYVKE